MTQDKDRAAFEAWYQTTGRGVSKFDAWQAAITHDRQQRGESVGFRWRHDRQSAWIYEQGSPSPGFERLHEVEPLFAAPQPAEPVTIQETVASDNSEPVKVPSDEDIEAIALESGICKSSEHWGDRYYTELGRNLFTFARALLARYGHSDQANKETQ